MMQQQQQQQPTSLYARPRSLQQTSLLAAERRLTHGNSNSSSNNNPERSPGEYGRPSLWHDLGNARYRRWLLRASLYEYLGSFIFVLIMAASGESLQRLGNVVIGNDALGHGLAAFVATYIVVHISGAVLNPALAMGLWLTRRIDALTVVTYTLAEVAGSLTAAGLLRAAIGNLTRGVGVPILDPRISVGQGILIEAMLGFILFFVMVMHYMRGRYFWYGKGYRFHLVGPVPPIHSALMAFGFAGAAEAAFVTTVGTGPNLIRWLGPAVVAGTYVNWPVWVTGPYIGVLAGAVTYGIDASLLRPDRTAIDLGTAKLADRDQRRQQGTRTAHAPEPPGSIPLIEDLSSPGFSASAGI